MTPVPMVAAQAGSYMIPLYCSLDGTNVSADYDFTGIFGVYNFPRDNNFVENPALSNPTATTIKATGFLDLGINQETSGASENRLPALSNGLTFSYSNNAAVLSGTGTIDYLLLYTVVTP